MNRRPRMRPKRFWRIYKRTCLANGKSYIGITTRTLDARWRDGKGYNNPFLVAAIKQYGINTWIHEWIATALTENAALEIESSFIREFRTVIPNGYNILSSGNKNPMFDPIVKEKYIRTMRSPKVRAVLSANARNRTMDQKTRAKISATMTGMIRPESTRKKMRERKLSAKSRAKIAEAARKRRHTKKKSKEKISNSLKRYYST